MYNKRRDYFKDNDIALSLEEMDGHLFVHLVFSNVTKAAVKKAREVWDEIKEKCYWLGYEQINTYTKDMRVVKLFNGYEHLGKFIHNSEEYEVARWELK